VGYYRDDDEKEEEEAEDVVVDCYEREFLQTSSLLPDSADEDQLEEQREELARVDRSGNMGRCRQ